MGWNPENARVGQREEGEGDEQTWKKLGGSGVFRAKAGLALRSRRLVPSLHPSPDMPCAPWSVCRLSPRGRGLMKQRQHAFCLRALVRSGKEVSPHKPSRLSWVQVSGEEGLSPLLT